MRIITKVNKGFWRRHPELIIPDLIVNFCLNMAKIFIKIANYFTTRIWKMYKLKHVYICDCCGKVELPHKVYINSIDDTVNGLPIGWILFNKIHLCETCGKAYKQLQMNIQKMSETAAKVPFIGDELIK